MKSVVIIFPDPHLAYSPTVLGLRRELSARFETRILAFRNRQFPDVDEPFVQYLEIPLLPAKIYGLVNRYSTHWGKQLLRLLMRRSVQKHLGQHVYDHIIGVDPVSIWLLGNGYKSAALHLLSLELTDNTTLYTNRIDWKCISSLIIQSEVRRLAIAPHFSSPVFYLQNAPVFKTGERKQFMPQPSSLLFAGTGTAKFGLLHVLNFLQLYPEYTVTIQGKVLPSEMILIERDYAHLLSEGRLVINRTYLTEDELKREAAKFRIGFCFYDFGYPEIDNINYRTAPSGKMFLYFAAGVPVVGIEIEGLAPVIQFNAGKLINSMSPQAIHAAIQEIEIDYSSKVEGCYAAAEHFSFDRSAAKFIAFLQDN